MIIIIIIIQFLRREIIIIIIIIIQFLRREIIIIIIIIIIIKFPFINVPA